MLVNSLAPSTRASYRNCLLLYLQHNNCSLPNPQLPFPATTGNIISFIMFLKAKTYAPTTITSAVSALAFINKLYGINDQHSHFVILKMLEGYRRTANTPDSRLPITLDILHRLIDAVPHIGLSHFNQTLIKAMQLLAFHAFLRIGEMTIRSSGDTLSHPIMAADCTINFTNGTPSSLDLNIHNSKHNMGRTFHINILSTSNIYCPVMAMHSYLSLAKPAGGTLFQFSDATPVSRNFFANSLKKCLIYANINPNSYKSHSFRIGAATEAVSKLKLSDHDVQRLGRWKSNAVKNYIRVPSYTS